ncbi:glycoside hydrolase family 7 protein [Plenodomus tracheiphilus IPT5]|uniref:Glucanase n=1 Tax=Plenodomus tracheiphilus IPT5 TaxID=1408161 RepID=A0A6A7AUX1_9PLEO|nr:glycoside hydrolase family 7 protein [Plenodomus tracheiphilus IPT5]
MATFKLIVAALVGLTLAQTPGHTKENHPPLLTYKCTKAGGCKPLNTAVVLDSSMHSIHQKKNASSSCGNGGTGVDPAVCPDEKTCAANCIIEGIKDYGAYGVKTQGENLQLDMLKADGSSASPRIYLLAEDGKNYEMLKLTGKEFSFDVDVSKLPCGMNGALYLSEMEADGGRQALNPAGAAYGTGYCDAQCFVTPWINGLGNVKGKGVCCNEMDIWEANSRATQIAPHTCDTPSLFACTGDECKANGKCDKNGCGDNPYRHRNSKDFYGPGLKVDTTKPFTVVTQFPADKNGVLQAIVRKYVQNGVVIENAAKNITMDQEYCSAQGGAESYNRLGGHKGMGEALARGMVLAMSVWWDVGGGMNWLDAEGAGPCSTTEGFPDEIRKVVKAPVVKFSKIKWGEIESTYCTKKKGSGQPWQA